MSRVHLLNRVKPSDKEDYQVMIVPLLEESIKPFLAMTEADAGGQIRFRHIPPQDAHPSIIRKLADKVRNQNAKAKLVLVEHVPAVRALYLHVDLATPEQLNMLSAWVGEIFVGPRNDADNRIIHLMITMRPGVEIPQNVVRQFPPNVKYYKEMNYVPKTPDQMPTEVGLKEMKDMIPRKDWRENEDSFKRTLTDNEYQEDGELVVPH